MKNQFRAWVTPLFQREPESTALPLRLRCFRKMASFGMAQLALICWRCRCFMRQAKYVPKDVGKFKVDKNKFRYIVIPIFGVINLSFFLLLSLPQRTITGVTSVMSQ